MVIVPGDVNSTLAAALTANKMGVPLAHLEAGLRSFDRGMPEEINRILVDEITDVYFVTEQSGIDHLTAEGKPIKDIHFVGNTMIDTLVAFKESIGQQKVLDTYGIQNNDYILMTIHRPATADHQNGLEHLYVLLKELTEKNKVVFPMHPRTLNNITKFGLAKAFKSLDNLIITGPLDYFNFQQLIQCCKMVLTDSGGIQEETTFVQKPCLTLRPNTERPSTISMGSNTLLDFNQSKIMELVHSVNIQTYKESKIPELWDGRATERILHSIKELYVKN
jgi:UDP-N-acetylglucosamine 2-epimerase (non-hydrolysing)